MEVLALDEIRKKVIYQNTVDIWIAVCQEQGTEWHDPEKYKKFIQYLLKGNLQMKNFLYALRNLEEIMSVGKIRQPLVKSFQNQMMKTVQPIL